MVPGPRGRGPIALDCVQENMKKLKSVKWKRKVQAIDRTRLIASMAGHPKASYEERNEEAEYCKQSNQMATSYIFEGKMRFSDFNAVKENHARFVLELVKHLYYELRLYQPQKAHNHDH